MDTHHYYQYQVFRHQLNKLQAHKSSFQAWKCVSLGYALFATVLLAAKWHEVSTDLKLLQGIDQLLWSQQSATTTSGANSTQSQLATLAEALAMATGPIARLNRTLSLAELVEESSSGESLTSSGEISNPNPLAEFLNTATSNSSQLAPVNSSAALVSHMQFSLGRELNGNQLLKQEVEAFLGEFRSAKSTLGLSSLLVFVYIISWILMTLAVNDTRISNDVSLRNILLLSVFGAIDMAASVGFVMVRLIMILDSRTLREAPLKLSSDQLTAFTALRLIGMRSCSAYVDAYVSALVALLTILRLYAIVRAIVYYRFLRRFNDFNRSLHHQNQLSAAMMIKQQQQQTSEKQLHWKVQGNQLQPNTLQGFIAQNGAGPDLMRAPSKQWQQQQQQIDANGPATSSTTLRFSPEPNATIVGGLTEQRVQQVKLLSPNGKQQQVATLTFGDSTDEAEQQLSQQQHQLALNAAIKLEEQRSNAATFKSSQQQFELADYAKLASKTTTEDQRQQQQQQTGKTLVKVANGKQWPPLMVVPASESTSSDIELTSRANRSLGNNAAPSVLLVNGRPHKLVAAAGHSNQNELAQKRRRILMGYESAGGGFESEPVNLVSEQRARSRSRDNQMRLLAAANQIRMNSAGRSDHLFDQTSNLAKNGAEHSAFTLLSARQLDRLSRKLLAGATGSLALNPARGRRPQLVERVQPVNDSTPGSKYKLVGRYRPAEQRPAGDENAAHKRQVFDGSSFSAAPFIVQHEEADEERENEGGFVYAPKRPQRKLVQQQQRRLEDLLGNSPSGCSSSSSSGPPSDSDEAPTARAATTPEMAPNFPIRRNFNTYQNQHRRRHHRSEKLDSRLLTSAHAEAVALAAGRRQHQAQRVSLGSLRQTEELVSLEPAADIGASRDHLLGKYYYA